ncbi:ribonuclease E inhibitor RraB [Pseudoalteromonas sp. Isolate6]|uniref:ribonuclease E inhibitor RraB n=1 Tax=Pseudoalteromonas sp. Isolate6 TaxID=2908527 RepID=UPI001EFDD1E2|nr:ribonuclease E inhibitor RraB [Pseudoalteromonas sp. Isolate6]MCG9759318.1 ribonuclease E inhibitor RraB [Pseudoalteromonas sp. Isolate6]
MQFPNDDNGELLAEIAAAGVDLTQMQNIDFYILFEQADDAKRFISAIGKDELAPRTQLQQCPDTGVWEVITTVTMVPMHELLSQTEQYLESIANGYEGYGDGWGLMASEE